MQARASLLLTVVLAVAGPASATAAGPVGPKIVGGHQAADGAYPAQGYLEGEFGTFSCAGTLMSSTKFLTAAHCATDELGDPLPSVGFSVRLGSNSASSGGTVYSVSQVDVNSNYQSDPNGGYDVAMLTLSPADNTQMPLPLVSEGHPAAWAPGTTATVIGWGTTSENGNTSDQLLEAQVPIVSDSSCDADYFDFPSNGDNSFDSRTMVCAGNGTADTCSGDSGGPLMVNDGGHLALAGVTSFGNGCNRRCFPGVYARVGSEPLHSWVENAIDGGSRTSTTPSRVGPGTSSCAASPPPPASSSPAPTPPAAKTTPSALHVGVLSGQRLARALKHGLKPPTSGKSTKTLPAHALRTVTVKFSKRARAQLKSARHVTLKLVAVAVDAKGNKRATTRHILLRR